MADERLINRLMPEARQVHPVPWPGSDESVGLVVPTCAELQQAYAAARKHVSSTLGLALEAAVNGAMLQEEEEIRVLALVVLDVDGGQVASLKSCQLFKGPEEVRAKLSVDRRLHLVAHLNKIQEQVAEGWSWPEDGDSRARMVAALGLPPGAPLSAVAEVVERLADERAAGGSER